MSYPAPPLGAFSLLGLIEDVKVQRIALSRGGVSLSAIEGRLPKAAPSITHPPPSNGQCKNGS